MAENFKVQIDYFSDGIPFRFEAEVKGDLTIGPRKMEEDPLDFLDPYFYNQRICVSKDWNFDLSGICQADENGAVAILKDLRQHPANNAPKPEKVIFNYPATIVYWKDGTKTVVKAYDEEFDEEKGLAMAYLKKIHGNKGNYNDIFREWITEE